MGDCLKTPKDFNLNYRRRRRWLLFNPFWAVGWRFSCFPYNSYRVIEV